MKIEIRHLGIVDNATIELKPLTVFIGENGTGKTWTTYTLSAILGRYGYQKYLTAYLNNQVQQTYPPLDKAISSLLEKGNVQIDLMTVANDYAEAYLNDVARLALDWMPTFMATRRVNFEDLQVRVTIEVKTRFLDHIRLSNMNKKLSFDSLRHEALLTALKESGQATLYFYSESEGEMREKLPQLAVKQFVTAQLFQIFHSAFYSDVYLFPTERTGFIIYPFLGTEDTVAEIEQSGAVVKNTRLADPVKRFLENIVTSALTSAAKRKGQVTDNPQILDYVKLADFLEREILRGKVDFDTSRLHKELLFQPIDNTQKLEMPVVSSMVKELAPLVLCLRYLVTPNSWIIIDEPEMNLHPAVQIEFIEFLAMLVNAGLQVLITTQSPYLIDHLANLMKAAKQENKEKIKNLFYLEKTDAFLAKEQVSIYLFEQGTARNVLDEQGTIDWSTFGNVSSDVSDIYAQLPITTN